MVAWLHGSWLTAAQVRLVAGNLHHAVDDHPQASQRGYSAGAPEPELVVAHAPHAGRRLDLYL